MRATVTIEFQRPRPRSWPRRRIVALAVALALVVPATVLASHQFTDVPTGHTFHGDISKAKGAGLTAGCGATTFCPDDAVSRGQMTAFLNRGLGRIDSHQFQTSITSGTEATSTSASIRPGNPTGGTQFVLLIATVRVESANAGCPCEFRVRLRDSATLSEATPRVYIDLPAIPGGQTFTDGAGSISGAVALPTGAAKQYDLLVQRITGTANSTVFGTLSAVAIPFDGLGGNAIVPSAASQSVDSGGR